MIYQLISPLNSTNQELKTYEQRLPTMRDIMEANHRTISSVDGFGYVARIHVSGGDKTIGDVARLSREDVEAVRANDGLIKYLLRHGHLEPFEFVQLTFLMKVPIFVDRHIVRHRMSSRNERSGRYNIVKPQFYIPNYITKQQATILKEASESSYRAYKSMLAHGTKKEVARMALPQNMYTKYYWSIDLRNLLHFFTLRTHKSAQKDTRLYAEAILELTREVLPLTIEGWTELQNA